MSKHTFSIFLENLTELTSNLNINQTFELKDKLIYSRITNILRLSESDNIIFFDKNINILVELLSQTFKNNKSVFLKILEKNKNKKLEPEIILCTGLVKKSSFEELIYNASALGATVIQPILTDKCQQKWAGQKEIDRLKKIIIAACEQSKNYCLPELYEPIKISEYLKYAKNKNYKKIFFESDQIKATELIKELTKNFQEKIVLVFGPEGGFSDSEISNFKESNFAGYSLTQTILRSQEAVTVGLGFIRIVTK